MKNNFYLTTTLPYVNAKPHIGFALEIVEADAIVRFQRELGKNVVFNFGTDEHGQKIYQKALSEGKDPKEYCDEYAAKFDELKKALNLSYTNFIRTTDEKHIKAAQEFWKLCFKNGDIEKRNYKQKYCVGCELEKQDSDLVDGRCPYHPDKELEIIEEENYFFKFSKYQEKLLSFYESHPQFVIPESRYKEIKEFVKAGLHDFSVSRLKSKMPWGIPVPGDEEHVMYVWFDALVNYISTLDWPQDENNFKNFWPGIQVAGKDNLRQQSAIWQAMLLSANLPNSEQIFIHSFITVDGQKISKSLGNVVDPIELVNKYGTDAVRYFLLAKINPYEDSDYTEERFIDSYNSGLANGLGNLVARVAKLSEKAGIENIKSEAPDNSEVEKYLNLYRFDEAINVIWKNIEKLDKSLSDEKPWEIDDQEKLKEVMEKYAKEVLKIGYQLKPFLPETADKIIDIYQDRKISSGIILFPRLK